MYLLRYTEDFREEVQRLTRTNLTLKRRITKALYLLSQNPKHPSLKTHKAHTSQNGYVFSSWVTGDLRIIWRYGSEGQCVVYALSIGGHTGTGKVYT